MEYVILCNHEGVLMRNLFVFVFLSLFQSCLFAQETLKVSGHFEDNNRVFTPSQELKRALFIKTKGNLYLPDHGFFFVLSPESAKVLKRPYIILLSLQGGNQDEFYDNYGKQLSFNVQSLDADNTTVFYIPYKQKTLINDFFTNPKKTDILQWADVINYENISYVQEWINALDSNASILVESQIHYEKVAPEIAQNTQPHTLKSTTSIKTEPLKEIAKIRLHALEQLFPQTTPKTWEKKEWQEWHNQTMALDPTTATQCNSQTWNLNIKHSFANQNSAIYATDEATHRVFRLERTPHDATYANQQLLIFDMQTGKYYNYDLYSSKYPNATHFALLHVENNTLYALTQTMIWYRYEYDKASDKYIITKEVKLLPQKAYTQKHQWKTIVQSYQNGKTMYLLFKEEAQNEHYVLSLDALSGENIHLKPIKSLLGDSILKSKKPLSFCSFNYVNQTQSDFYFCVAQEQTNTSKDAFYLFKTSPSLEHVQSLPISRDETYGWLMADATTLYTISDLEESVLVQKYDINLTKRLSQTTIPTPKGYDQIRVSSSNEQVALYRYEKGLLNEAIVKYELDRQLTKTLGKKCAYSYLPIEEITSENQPIFSYASPIADNNWLIFLQNQSNLRYSQTK